MTAVRLAICDPVPEPDPDREPLSRALDRAGIPHRWVAWDDEVEDWSSSEATVLRATWDYATRPDEFAAWCRKAASGGPFINPVDVVFATMHKRYLVELAEHGVPATPTVVVERGPAPSGDELASALACQRIVVKPAVAAASRGARVFAASDPELGSYAANLAAQEDILVQPYWSSVEDYGERSLVWIDGELSHAVRKSPRWSGGSESVSGPVEMAADEREVALAALARYEQRILYGRVDVARDDSGQPVVMELELIEPSLFFSRRPGSADRFAAGLARMLKLG